MAGTSQNTSAEYETVVVTVSRNVGDLVEILKLFRTRAINPTHIESRPSTRDNSLDYFIEFPAPPSDVGEELISEIKGVASQVTVGGEALSEEVWFPRHISEVRKCCTTLFKYGAELAEDHPGYGDLEYMARRREISEMAKSYVFGQEIPRVAYTETERKTWGVVFKKQTTLYPTHACEEYNEHFPQLFADCGYRENNIPQLEDVSQYLQARTGWRLWPVIGWISSRHFLNALAFRVFPTSQYIRHSSSPLYTPEPDICHELMGHAPLFCDPFFAQFSQEVGMASLGISDEWIARLATLYWFTVEFGMVKGEDGQARACGAGLLSGSEELQYCITDMPTKLPLDIEEAVETSYPLTGLQPLYFVSESMEDMRNKLVAFSKSIPRSFSLTFEPSTLSVKVASDSLNV